MSSTNLINKKGVEQGIGWKWKKIKGESRLIAKGKEKKVQKAGSKLP